MMSRGFKANEIEEALFELGRTISTEALYRGAYKLRELNRKPISRT